MELGSLAGRKHWVVDDGRIGVPHQVRCLRLPERHGGGLQHRVRQILQPREYPQRLFELPRSGRVNQRAFEPPTKSPEKPGTSPSQATRGLIEKNHFPPARWPPSSLRHSIHGQRCRWAATEHRELAFQLVRPAD